MTSLKPVLALFVTLNLTALATWAAPAKLDAGEIKGIAEKYSSLVLNSYQKLSVNTQELQTRVQQFIKAPSQANQDAAKEAWKKTRLSYSPTEAFRFYAGPIDNAETNIEPMMNAWPIDESYIDSVQGKAQSGIINSPEQYPTLNKETLISMNEKGGERNVSTGYHAVEFLLWGQDLDLSTNGKRSFEDYLPEKNKNAQRRAQYLTTVTDLLMDHTQMLVSTWKPDAAYPKSFIREKPEEILRRILTGMTSLSADEMAGERMTVALEKHDQENEQDCFSDFTLSDLAANQEGVMAVYNQTGLKEFFAKTDKGLEKQISKQLEGSLQLIRAIPGPFDAVVSGGKKTSAQKQVQKAIDSLQKQAHLIAKMAKKFKVELNVQ